MTMIKCPECRHHISSMAKACPECGAPIDPEWAEAEARKELEKLEEVPFTVEVGGEDPVSDDSTPQSVQADSQSARNEEGDWQPPTDDSRIADSQEQKQGGGSAGSVAGKSGGASWLLALVVLLGLCIGGLYYYDYRAQQQREQRAYELLQGCSNPDFYEDFIIRFPKSEHIDEVRERLQVVMAQQNEWQKLILKGTRDELRQFVQLHPTSPYVKVAQGRIDSLDWAEAKELRSLEAVTHYMAAHPDGYYIDQAETLRQTLERQRQEAAALAAAQRDSLALTDSVAAP